MTNVIYSLRDRRKIPEPEYPLTPLHLTLDALGNNLMAMLWLAQLALGALQEGDDMQQARKNLQDALQAGDCAKKLLRQVLNSQNSQPEVPERKFRMV